VNIRGDACEGLEHVAKGDRDADIGLFHGFADGLAHVRRHKRMVGYHVGDVDVIPPEWVRYMNRLDLVITQSQWCRQVFSRSGVRVPVHISRAGVDEACVPGPEREPGSPLRVVHFNSSDDGVRKGTPEVIAAMQKLAGRLPIVVEVDTHSLAMRQAVQRANAPGLVLAPEHKPLAPDKMAELIRSYDLLLCPSRAEGLGLFPVEFLSCGVPVVATTCTGHSETLEPGMPGLVPVQVGALAPCGRVGRAPSLSPDSIVSALKSAVSNYSSLRAAARASAEALGKKWRWDAILDTDRFASIVLAR
jgi:glycosyltransferase involved in cell wall biosynthesis